MHLSVDVFSFVIAQHMADASTLSFILLLENFLHNPDAIKVDRRADFDDHREW